MRRTKEDTDKTREKILEAALIVFNNQGYQAATVDGIAKYGGMSKGLIFWHFKNKETLYRTIIEESLTKVKELIDSFMKTSPEPYEVFEKFLTTLIDDWQRKNLQLTILNNLLKENKEEFTDLIDLVQSHFDFIIVKLTEMISSGIEKGIFKKHLNADFIARSIFTLVLGFFTGFETVYKNYSESDLKQNFLVYLNEMLFVK